MEPFVVSFYASALQSGKQFYLDQAKRLKDTFSSKHPDYVYRRRPNNSSKRRKNDTDTLSMTDPGGPSGSDPPPLEGTDGLDYQRASHYPFSGQNPQLSPAGLDEMFPHNSSSTLQPHGSYSGHPYPQSRHQPNSDHPSHRSSLQGSLSFPHRSFNSHVSGNGYQSPHSGYWNDRASGSPHTGGSSYSSNSSTATATPLSSSHWSSSMLPPIPSHFPSHTREQSYTITALPTVKSPFPTHGSSPGMLQSQLPLPPLNSVGNGNSGGGGSGVPHRPWSTGPNSQSGNSGDYLPTLTSAFYPPSPGNAPPNSPSWTNTSSNYLSPPSTTSSTSTGGDRPLTPPELTYDLPRPAVGEVGIGGPNSQSGYLPTPTSAVYPQPRTFDSHPHPPIVVPSTQLMSIDTRSTNIKASLGDRIDILNSYAVEAPPANQVFKIAGNILALVRVRTVAPRFIR